MLKNINAVIFRLLLPVLFITGLLIPAVGLAATLEWSALPDRERVTIVIGEAEGIPGQVARIDLHALVIPFTIVPPGLDRVSAPPESKLFLSTRQLGHALALQTKTPEFGFVVAEKTPSKIVIDFFHNRLGARWKPSEAAPTTEIAPTEGLREFFPDDPDTARLSSDPAGTTPSPVETQQPETPAPQEPVVQPANRQEAPPVPAVPEQINTPPVEQQTPAPVQDSSSQTALPQPPIVEQPSPQPPVQPEGANPPQPSTSNLGREIIPPPGTPGENRPAGQQPAPIVEPPVQNSGQGTGQPVVDTPIIAGSTPAEPQDNIPAPGPVEPVVQAETPPVQNGVEDVPPGVAVRKGEANVYEGTINFGNMDSAPVSAPSGSAGTSASPQPSQSDGSKLPLPEYGDVSSAGSGKIVGAEAVIGEKKKDEGHGAAAEEGPPEVIYEDKDGNPVDPPLEPAIALEEAKNLMRNGQHSLALPIIEKLLGQTNLSEERFNLNDEQREEALHARADCVFLLHENAIEENFVLLSDVLNQAINFNHDSNKNPVALLRLGYINLKMNNIPEARARFNMLRQRFPLDDNVPLTYYYWGDYYYGRGEYQKAADEFQYILQHYANTRYAREASLGLARSFDRMGYYKEAFAVVQYVEQRWPRFYVEHPPFLTMMGDVAFRLNDLPTANKYYLLYANLEPYGAETDVILTRIGDIYNMEKEKLAARDFYQESIRRFPDKDGALVAKMRLAEDGINDEPSIAGMFNAFDLPLTYDPFQVYTEIIQDHPDSSLAPLATLKTAMWHLWQKDYQKTLETCDAFLKKYPEDPLAPRVKELAMQTFAVLSTESVRDQRYARMREVWEKYPFVREGNAELSPDSRIALAISYRDSGRPDEALAAVEPFFLGHKVPEYSEMALNLVLGIYLQYEQWPLIRQVARQIELWELSDNARRQLDFSLALASENMGDSDAAAPLWQKLYDSGRLSQTEQALAAFFIARSAESHRELEKAYIMGKDSLTRLVELAERNPDQADYGKIQSQIGSLMDITETAGRLREALQYAERYLAYHEEGTPGHVAVLYRIARIYKRMGNNEEWHKRMVEIAQKYPDDTYGRTAASELRSSELMDAASQYSPTGNL